VSSDALDANSTAVEPDTVAVANFKGESVSARMFLRAISKSRPEKNGFFGSVRRPHTNS
jgi:hypothetical protein